MPVSWPGCELSLPRVVQSKTRLTASWFVGEFSSKNYYATHTLNHYTRDSPLVFCFADTIWTGGGDEGELAELMSLAMSRYKCSDSPLDASELRDAWLFTDDDRLRELDNGRPLGRYRTLNFVFPADNTTQLLSACLLKKGGFLSLQYQPTTWLQACVD